MKLSLEPAGESVFDCRCCGRQSTTVHGYIWDEAGRTTVYFAGFTDGHAERSANVLLSVGEWGEGTTGDDRHVVVLHAKSSTDVDVVDPSVWPSAPDEALLGKTIDHSALSDADVDYVRDLARFALRNDPRTRAYLADA